MRPALRRSLVACLLTVAGVRGIARAGDDPALPTRIEPGEFDRFAGEDHDGWRVTRGAGKPLGRGKRPAALSGGGVAFEGDASTTRWTAVSKWVAVRPGASYSLTFEQRAVGLKLEPGQPGDAYTGVKLVGATPVDAPVFRVAGPSGEAFAAGEIVFRAPGAEASVMAFLSMTGRLEVRHVELRELSPAESLDVLAREMGRWYAHFDPAGPSWDKAVAGRRASFPKDGESVAFVEAAKALLAPLRDPHVWIRPSPGAALVVPFAPVVPPNGDLAVVARALAGVRRVGKVAIVGEVGADVGYLNLASLAGKGVPPDVVVDAKGPGDPTFDAGLALLREKIAARPR